MRKMESAAPGMRLREQLIRLDPRRLQVSSLPRPTLTLPTPGQALTSGWHASKLLSGFLLLAAVTLIVWIQSDERWFVYADAADFQGASYLSDRELFAMTGANQWNVFWLRPDDLQENLLQHPYVVTADVRISLPNRLEVTVEEPEPVAVWMTKEGPLWVLDDGAVLEIRIPPGGTLEEQLQTGSGAQLPVLVDMQRSAVSARRLDLAVDEEVLNSALALLNRLPAVTQIRYNAGYGLNFALPETPYWVYWGDGSDLEDKLVRLQMTREMLDNRELRGLIIDVRFDDRLVTR